MLTENMLWAWNVVFVCNTKSIFLCVSTSEAESPLLHITTLTTEPQYEVVGTESHRHADSLAEYAAMPSFIAQEAGSTLADA